MSPSFQASVHAHTRHEAARDAKRLAPAAPKRRRPLPVSLVAVAPVSVDWESVRRPARAR